ncbi:MAG: thymidylate kinase [Tepidisphaeraceae bacterium]|jgi:dTMP kinase
MSLDTENSPFRYMGHAMPYLPRDGCTGKLIVIEGTDGCGRSTQAILLKEWLEVQGYAVIDTGWTRSKLVGKAITDAKQGHSLHRLTYCLMYATDLADRMEYQIIPALRGGFIVLADRYIYTLLARGVVRDADKGWLRDLFSFAVQPDLVFYLQLGVEQLVPRVLEAGKMNYWESGLDMSWGDDLFDSFVAYQGELIQQFDVMAEEFAFHCVDARQDPRAIQRQLRQAVTAYLESSNYSAPGAIPGEK